MGERTIGERYRALSKKLSGIREDINYRSHIETEEESDVMDAMDELWVQLSREEIEALHKEGHFVRGYDDEPITDTGG